MSPAATQRAPLTVKSFPNQLSIVIKYNYYPEKLKLGESYSNQFENCFIYITDENGKAVKVEAEKGQEVLEQMLAEDESSCHLGEVALVPYTSPKTIVSCFYVN